MVNQDRAIQEDPARDMRITSLTLIKCVVNKYVLRSCTVMTFGESMTPLKLGGADGALSSRR